MTTPTQSTEAAEREALLHQAEIALAALISYQSSGKAPTIHEYGHARRTLEAVRATLSQQTAEPVAWADDAAIQGRVGNVCSTAAKRYWGKSDGVDRKNAELHIHPLYTAPPPQEARELTDAQIDAGAATLAAHDGYFWDALSLNSKENKRGIVRAVIAATAKGKATCK